MNNLLFVVYEPAQIFDSSISASLLKDNNNIVKNIRCTTRMANPGENNGENYFFITKLDFLGRVAKAELLEYCQSYDGYYATDKNFVLEQLASHDVMLEMEPDMARQIKKNYPAAVLIMIAPKSIDAYIEKLKADKKVKEQIDFFITKAKKGLKEYSAFDYVIINEDIEKTKTKILEILESERNRALCFKEFIQDLEEN